MIRLLKTESFPCGYFPDRAAQYRIVDPFVAMQPGRIYGQALSAGFRRAGKRIYKPDCAACAACIASRIPVDEFAPNRTQKRCLSANSDLVVSLEPAVWSEEAFALYGRYLAQRHAHGGMDANPAENFADLVNNALDGTRFLAMRDGAGKLLAVAATDFTDVGLSAVYTFFDPTQGVRSLGTFAVLKQIEIAKAQGLPALYLGYWIEHHPKMGYKSKFKPLEIEQGGRWRQLDDY